MDENIIRWLLQTDVSLQYQVHRDLLKTHRPDLQEKIAREGWGEKLLSRRNTDGSWGMRFYQPKWTSSHYSLMDLRHLCISPAIKEIKDSIHKIIQENTGEDGGINPAVTVHQSDVCLNGMFLNYASYFKISEEKLHTYVDFIISQQMTDGGFNCNFNMKGASHSSLHSTISILEGIHEYYENGYTYRLGELKRIQEESGEFILQHHLYKSHRTGKIIDNKMLMLSYPSRWRYDILRALDYFRSAGVRFDNRMSDAIDVLLKKQRKDGKWPLQCKHPGQTHFDMEQTGEASRWNTLRALRVLSHCNIPHRTA